MADNSFIYLNRIAIDKSRLFENAVFHFLLRKYGKVHYYKTENAKEVDFLIAEPKQQLIQVSVSLQNAPSKEREINSLLTAMNELNLSKAEIYTYNENETLEIQGKTIEIKAFWKLCLTEE